MAHLRSSVLIITDLDLVGHAPLTIPFNHPLPGQAIEIVKVLVRQHWHTPLPHPASIAAILVRASDQSPIGGSAVDTLGPGNPPQYVHDYFIDYSPNSFLLGPTDNLLLNVQSLEGPADATTETSISVLIGWYVQQPAKFVNIITAGNRFIGLKDDGTFWQSANVTPLVWTQV